MGKSTAQKFGENMKMSKPKDVDSYIAIQAEKPVRNSKKSGK